MLITIVNRCLMGFIHQLVVAGHHLLHISLFLCSAKVPLISCSNKASRARLDPNIFQHILTPWRSLAALNNTKPQKIWTHPTRFPKLPYSPAFPCLKLSEQHIAVALPPKSNFAKISSSFSLLIHRGGHQMSSSFQYPPKMVHFVIYKSLPWKIAMFGMQIIYELSMAMLGFQKIAILIETLTFLMKSTARSPWKSP